MGKTTIEIDEEVRNDILNFKDKLDYTYSDAIEHLLTLAGEPTSVATGENDLSAGTGNCYYSPVTSEHAGDVCTFQQNFLSCIHKPMKSSGFCSELSWEEFGNSLASLRPYLSNHPRSSSFSIRQCGGVWYGHGLGTFFEALKDRESRYEQAGISNPRSDERAVYLDSTENGLICLMLKSNDYRLENVIVQFVTDGVPLVPAPYTTITQQFGMDLGNAHDLAPETMTMSLSGKPEVVNTITWGEQRRDPVVRALRIRNPLYDDPDQLRSMGCETPVVEDFSSYKHVPCYLTGHPPVDASPDYELRKITIHSTGLGSNFGFYNVECRADTQWS